MVATDVLTRSRALRLVIAGMLMIGWSVALGAPARAATAPPWRFTSVTTRFHLAGHEWVHKTLQCPPGYRPIGGGVAADFDYPSAHHIRRDLEFTDQSTGTYHIALRNWSDSATAVGIRVTATCVWADHLGPIEYRSRDFTKSSSTERAGGTVSCPYGYRALTGGADWAGGSWRTIDFSSPVLDDAGQPAGWYAAGLNRYDDAGALTVEVYCVEQSYLASAYAEVDISPSAPISGEDFDVRAMCQSGYRMLTGGSYPWGSTFPTQDRGWAWASGPVSARSWGASGTLVAGDQLRAVGICIPASTPSVSLTQTPPELTTSRSATFQFAASDPVGEDLTIMCRLDNEPRSECSPGEAIELSDLPDGMHEFWVDVANESERTAYARHEWKVDATAPVVETTAPEPPARLTGRVTITFSEPVRGVPASAIQVHGMATNVDLPGAVSRPAHAKVVWRSRRPLVPGETYRVSLSGAIRDIAGNHLIATFWDIRAATAVQNDARALRETWDEDRLPIASGGAYITSRTAGSTASLVFTARDDQVVSVFGIRLPDGGLADIYLDGVKATTASFYAPSARRVKVYTSPALGAGRHTLSVRPLDTRPTASTGTWVSIDNLTVGAAVRQESALTQQFRRVTATNALGGSFDVISHKTDTDGAPAYTATIVGTGVKVYAPKTNGSGSARIFIDNVLKATVNLHSASTVHKALVYSTTFASGPHVIRIEPVGTPSGGASAVGFDYLTVK